MQKKSVELTQAFAILGVTRDCPVEQLRLAYRRLVKRWHPDQYARDPVARADAEARLKTINQAYAAIKVYLKTAQGPPPAEPGKDNERRRPKTGFGDRFRTAFHFAGGIKTPPQPDPCATPRRPPQRPATDFQEALNAAGGAPRDFKQPTVSTSPPARAFRCLRARPKGRCRSMRVEPVEPVSRIRPVAPIGRIGDGD